MKRSTYVFPAFLLTAAVAFSCLPDGDVNAQCGSSVSSCKSCHEIQKQMPISNVGQYHIDHAKLDACDSCHAGQPFATDEARGKVGFLLGVSPLGLNSLCDSSSRGGFTPAGTV